MSWFVEQNRRLNNLWEVCLTKVVSQRTEETCKQWHAALICIPTQLQAINLSGFSTPKGRVQLLEGQTWVIPWTPDPCQSVRGLNLDQLVAHVRAVGGYEVGIQARGVPS